MSVAGGFRRYSDIMSVSVQGRKSSVQIQISQTVLHAGFNDVLLWKNNVHCQKQSLCTKENFYLSPL